MKNTHITYFATIKVVTHTKMNSEEYKDYLQETLNDTSDSVEHVTSVENINIDIVELCDCSKLDGEDE